MLDSGSSVGDVNAPADVSGTGAIGEAVINVAGCTIEQKPTEVTVAPGVTAVVDGKTVASNRWWSGDAADRDNRYGVAISGEAVVGEELTASPSPAGRWNVPVAHL